MRLSSHGENHEGASGEDGQVIIGMVEGCTRIIGKSQGYLGLPLRDEVIQCNVNGEGTPAMVTAWELTPDEIARVALGAPVHLRVLGAVHPPVMIYVGKVPDPT